MRQNWEVVSRAKIFFFWRGFDECFYPLLMSAFNSIAFIFHKATKGFQSLSIKSTQANPWDGLIASSSLHSFVPLSRRSLRRHPHPSQTLVVVLLIFVTLVVSIFGGGLRRKSDLNVTRNCLDMLPYKTKPMAALIKARRSMVSPKRE